MTLDTLFTALSTLVGKGKCRPIDFQFARFISRFDDNPLIVLTAALVSSELTAGNVCLPLKNVKKQGLFGVMSDDLPEALQIDLSDEKYLLPLLDALNNSTVEGDNSPLKLSHGRLYLQRYWSYEKALAKFIRAGSNTIDQSIDQRKLDELFIQNNNEEIDWQKLAVTVSSTHGFSVITGGPGTGKTTTVINLLALLIHQHQLSNSDGSPLQIKLIAPTGKAAARLTESMISALENKPDLKALIPEDVSKASTIHRLLGVIPRRTRFRHHQENPLHLDVLIVDEASMIDLSLMASLLDALTPSTRLVLLGDKDQLSSVEAGAVFAQICNGLSNGAAYTQKQNQWLSSLFNINMEEHTPSSKINSSISDSLSLLQKSYRFDKDSGIGHVAKMINQGDTKGLQTIWDKGYQDLAYYPLNESWFTALSDTVIDGYKSYLELAPKMQEESQAAHIIDLFSTLQLLTPLRQGYYGVDNLNALIEQKLKRLKLIIQSDTPWYCGRPVMIVQNDYQQQLFNGDIGIVLPSCREQGGLRVYFKMSDGSIKSFLPSRLPETETVYAMSIHKSQGSEFDEVVMLLPLEFNPVMTRELIYTGITRAKKMLHLFANMNIIEQSVKRKTIRHSGLAELLEEG